MNDTKDLKIYIKQYLDYSKKIEKASVALKILKERQVDYDKLISVLCDESSIEINNKDITISIENKMTERTKSANKSFLEERMLILCNNDEEKKKMFFDSIFSTSELAEFEVKKLKIIPSNT